MKVGRFAVATHPGRKRRGNEDAYVCEPPLFAVADGMGGAQAGEIASQLAAAAVRESGADGGTEQRIHALMQEANVRVYDRSSTDPETSGMGTTMTVALVTDSEVAIGHVGDSRAYRLRDGRLEQLTEDHSLVAELVRSGKLSREEAESHPQRSVITRALGTDPDVDADTFTVDAREGDLFLLCSDGLTDMVSQSAIRELVERNRDSLEGAIEELIKAANRGGGEDNITVILFDITTKDVEETKPMAAVGADEEDTLDELDRVPTVESVDELLGESEAPRRRWPWVLLALAVLAVAAYAALRLLT